jgi:hypothetical protein
MLKEAVDFISVFQILPRHVLANGCHLQGVVDLLGQMTSFSLYEIPQQLATWHKS